MTPSWNICSGQTVMGRVEEMVMVIVIREEVMVIMTVRVGREEEAGEMAGQEEAERD